MSAETYQAVLTGQFNIVKESSSTNLYSDSLADFFDPITSIAELKRMSRQLVAGDGETAIPAEGVSSMKGMALYVSGSGTVTFRHDANSAGMVIGNGEGFILFGTLGSPTIQTDATQAMTVTYCFFE